MEKFLSSAPLPPTVKRLLSILLWTLMGLALALVVSYFIYQWLSSKTSKEKIKDQGTFIAEQGLVITAIKEEAEVRKEAIKEKELLETEEVLAEYEKALTQTKDPKVKEVLEAKRDRAVTEIKMKSLWAIFCQTPVAVTSKPECGVEP